MSKAQEVRYYAENSGARLAFVAQELLENFEEGRFDRIVVHAYSEAVGDTTDEIPDWVLEPLRPLTRPDCTGWASVPRPGRDGRRRRHPSRGPRRSCPTPRHHRPPQGLHAHPPDGAGLAGRLGTSGRDCIARPVVLAVAPLFHMLGLQNGMNMPIFLGRHLGHAAALEPGAGARLIERHRVTAWTAPPAMILDFIATPRWSSATSPA
jgi:fatty-acyl-CoA synthase